MRKNILVFLFVMSVYSLTSAQVKQVTIIDNLKTAEAGKGIVEIESDSRITDLIGFPISEVSLNESAYRQYNGFRIQVFMSNNSRTGRSEATHKGNLIREMFPDKATYITYEAPNWKLLAGDFLSREEAEIFKQQLRKAFPDFGKEMYTISDKINIPIRQPK